jgi:uncharacterized coiled-coil protein SlyX
VLASHEADTRNIPDLIKLEFRLANSQRARLSHDVVELQRRMDAVEGKIDALGGKVGVMEGKVDALPRVLADLIVETLDKRDNKG